MKDLLNRYKTCQSCEQLSTEINYIRDVEMKDLEDRIQQACDVINQLYDMIEDPTLVRNGTDLQFAEVFLKDNWRPTQQEIKDMEDELPF
jgi:hypothetical protein